MSRHERVLIDFKPHSTETEPAWPGARLRSWRWRLVWCHGLGVEEAVSFDGGRTWGRANRYAFIHTSRRIRLGYHKEYYDGDHRILNLGPFSLQWGW